MLLGTDVPSELVDSVTYSQNSTNDVVSVPLINYSWAAASHCQLLLI